MVVPIATGSRDDNDGCHERRRLAIARLPTSANPQVGTGAPFGWRCAGHAAQGSGSRLLAARMRSANEGLGAGAAPAVTADGSD
eukprot:379529-Lingulodinium_polyedra.AAC.1